MTFGSFSANALKLIVILPLVLTRLETPDIALWYLFATIMTLINLADIGFCPTFSRLIAYAMAGADLQKLRAYKQVDSEYSTSPPNWQTVETICSSMRAIYQRLTALLLLLLLFPGTAALHRPITASSNPFGAWISWAIVISTSAYFLHGNAYRAYLEGTNHIALIRRWDIYTAFGATITSVLSLLLGTGLVGLVVSQQSWAALNTIRNRYLCSIIEEGRHGRFKGRSMHTEVTRSAWSSAWRSGLGILMSHGLFQVSGVIYAQLATSEKLASYLLGLRLIQAVSQFSQAPFYSKLPLLARLRLMGKTEELIYFAQRGMKLSYWVFALSFAGIAVLANTIFLTIKSNVTFPDPIMWSLLGIGILTERYGAMHIQLYTTTNHIIWHIANSVSGMVFLAFSSASYLFLGVYAFPVGMIAGNLLYYDWYTASHSHKTFSLSFWHFEGQTSLKPTIFMLVFISQYLWHW